MSFPALTLPFATEDTSRKDPFSREMELASLLWTAEAERKKKPGRIFGKHVESLTFVSKLHYPLWAIQWGDKSLLLDGMALTSSSILYFRPPDVEAFIEHLKRSSKAQELYYSTLRSHRKTFSEFVSQTEFQVEGVITEKELLSDISSALTEGKREGKLQATHEASLVQPKVIAERATEVGVEVLEHCRKLQSEIKGLRFAIETAEQETNKHVGKLEKELEQILDKYETKLSKTEANVAAKRKRLEEELDTKTQEIDVVHRRETGNRIAEKEKLEREMLKLEQKKSEYEKRRDLRKLKNDQVGEARWESRLRDVRGRISTVRGKIRTLEDFIESSNRETEAATKRLQESYQKLIAEEEKRITELEEQRDLETKKREKTIEELQKETESIIEKINKLIERKTERLSVLEEATLSWAPRKTTMIQIPFYLIQCEAGRERRYIFRSPITAKGREGLTMKIRSFVKMADVNSLLRPRSKALDKFLALFKKKIEEDKGLQRKLSQLGTSNNLLDSPGFEESFRKGLAELEAEGWISPEDKAALLKVQAAN